MHMAAQIQRLACAVLSVMLQNFRSALRATPTGSMSGPDRVRKAGWSPSWIEEYRTYWALWQLQHCWDLRAAAERRLPPGDDAAGEVSWGGWSWSAKEIDKLDKVGTFGLRILAFQFDFPQLQEILHMKMEKLLPLFAPCDNSLHPCDYPVWCSPPAPNDTNKADFKWQLSTGWANSAPRTGVIFRLLVTRTRNLPEWFRCWDVPALRRLGLGLWDYWRMYSAGLMECPPGRVPTPDGGFRTVNLGTRKLFKPDYTVAKADRQGNALCFPLKVSNQKRPWI
ncbi:uncharacterized protein ASPGLDRAFT_79993 [Aspergillus glaucus CBS 516.65]|uniref:Uncharacterized protein n=1 Tax=Aspergillus glaucus CBS 516.65 TaxID=1160497 RepID=A0A1L9VT73_ASPGL|nr:hypothetical protein ASPGLDRAFT_79993 [Aspergillus glaucus CBS 516.65]OJJ87096.1 hypothetical protein ASPGLDRAFT_79993 [Aspergillus glaucus CBS 516.65]